MTILSHLLDSDLDDFEELDTLDTPALLSAQAGTVSFYESMGSPEHVLSESNARIAREAFAAVLNPDMAPTTQKAAVLALKVPEAVKHLAGMLTQYDWDYVEQAKELRGYVVAKLLEESKSPRASDRLRALQLIGTLTEVGSFTERSVVTHVQESCGDIEERLRARLKSMLPPVLEVQDAEVKDVAAVKRASPTPP
jgi:hypothetical protein